MRATARQTVELCSVDDCGRPAERRADGPWVERGFCAAHQARKFGKSKVMLEAPIQDKYANGSTDLSSTDRLALAAREYAEADVSDDKAYSLALRNLVAAARLRTLRPITGMRLPGFFGRRDLGPGVVEIRFKERRK